MLRMIVEIIIVVIVVNEEIVANVVIGIVVIVPPTRVSMTQIGDDQINKKGDHQVYYPL